MRLAISLGFISAHSFPSFAGPGLEDITDFNQMSQKLLAHCRDADGPFDNAVATKIIGELACSLLKSAGVLVPGAGLVVDLCLWVGERVNAIKESQESAAKLGKEVVLASKNLQRRMGILKKCDRALVKSKADTSSERDVDFEDAIADFYELLPGTWTTLTRAGQVVTKMPSQERGVMESLKLIFGAKTVSSSIVRNQGQVLLMPAEI